MDGASLSSRSVLPCILPYRWHNPIRFYTPTYHFFHYMTFISPFHFPYEIKRAAMCRADMYDCSITCEFYPLRTSCHEPCPSWLAIFSRVAALAQRRHVSSPAASCIRTAYRCMKHARVQNNHGCGYHMWLKVPVYEILALFFGLKLDEVYHHLSYYF